MNFLSPYLGIAKAGAIVAAALALFAAGWTVNGWRLGEKDAEKDREHAEAVAAAIETARLKERSLNKTLEDARNAAITRETALRRDAGRSRDAADGLRDELAELRRNLPGLAADACRVRADALAVVLNDCQQHYRSLAEKADRHASDVQTLIEGWPK